ncbi:MAG TPA: hypothetical protein VHW64_09750 [Nocardioides sp.]|uniref:hypothetical protein n=1 Tax=Nocardioides sp. TaxID=35761 RepID=UPI002E34DEF0|nr:hypothetical protein [Nocardioides sp.]HEX3930978.1 hypothetical protein [Nocardioides sp.]
MSGSRGSRFLSRRRVLWLAGGAGVATAGALGGCDLDPRPTPTPPPPAPGPDDHIVQAARAELRELLVRLRATPGTADLVACHRSQLAALGGHPATARRPGPALTQAELVDRERRAAERFRRWALRSSDGDLARVLACVAAGVSMQPELRGPA